MTKSNSGLRISGVALDWSGKVPLAEQVSAAIRRLYLQRADAGARLPTEYQLAARFGVSRAIARRAMDLLRREGAVFRRPRHGTFAAKRAQQVLTVAYFEENKYSFAALLDRFERFCPAVRLARVALPINGYCEIVRQMLEEGRVDLVRISASLFKGFDAPAHFMSLNGLGRKYAAMTHAAPWAAFRVNKTRYGVPLAFGPVVVAYNRALWRAAGAREPAADWSLSDFLALAERLARPARGASEIPQYGFLCPNLSNRWMMFVYSHGGRLWDAARGVFGLAAPGALAGLLCLREMVEQKICAPLHGVADPYRLFVRGKAAMTLISYHTIPTLRPALQFEWDVAPFPRCRRPARLLLADGLALARQTTNLAPAEAFLDFCLGAEAQGYIAAQGGPIPARADLAESAIPAAPGNYNMHQDLAGPPCFPELPLGDHRERVAADETMLYVNGMQSAAEYCANLAAAANPA